MAVGKITFDESAENDILELFGKAVDDEGFIVEAAQRDQKVLTPQGEEIPVCEWGGVTKGSEAFVKGDAFTLLKVIRKSQ